MKNSILILSLLLIMGITLLTSCGKDDDNNNDAKDSRNVRYELTGTARGNFDITLISGDGSGTIEKPTTLPWTKEIVAAAGTQAVGFTAAVVGATPGTTITARIFVGGVEKKVSQPATVQSDGIAIIGGFNYVLK